MCNINILYQKVRNKTVAPFLMAVTSHSYASNSDGEGVYVQLNDLNIKSKQKINLFDMATQIDGSDLIVTHQRFSTSGFHTDYNHPFENDNFVMVHNGVINQFKEKQGSDTFGFWNKFNKKYDELDTKLNRLDRVKRVLFDLFKVDEGSYSIFIYDKKTKNAFYFKSSGTYINFYKNSEYLFITTNHDNKKFLDMISQEKFVELAIETRVLYRIDFETKDVFKVNDFPEVKKTKTDKNFSKSWEKWFGSKCDACGDIYSGISYQNKDGKWVCESCKSIEQFNTIDWRE